MTVKELIDALSTLVAEGKGDLTMVYDDYADYEIEILQVEEDRVRVL